RGDVRLLAFRIFDTDDQHVFGHPALVARDVGSDAQRETLLAEQSVAAITRTVRPNLARLRKMDDVLFFVARPRHISLSGSQRSADRMHARYYTLSVLIDLRVDGPADARHDAHVHYHVRRVGKLHANLRHWRTDRAHAEREHIHRASLHRALKKFFEFSPHLVRLFPIVGGTRTVFRERTDERAIFNSSDVGGV